jgi:putative transposase
MLNGYRVRLDPRPEQAPILLRWMGCQRLIYNAKVQEDRYFRRFQRRMVGLAGATAPVDQRYSQFITEQTAFLREVPSQVLRNGSRALAPSLSTIFPETGWRPKLKTTAGRHSVCLTAELFRFIPRIHEATGEVPGYHFWVGTDTFPVGIMPYVAHRRHAVPSSMTSAVEGGRWWLSFAAEDPEVTRPGHDADAATERIAETLRHRSADPLAAQTLGSDRGVAKPVVTSHGQVFDLRPIQKTRIPQARRQRQRWQRRASRRKNGSQNQKKAYRNADRYQQYEKNVRHAYAHQTSQALVVNAAYDLYVFEDLAIQNMTKRPKARRDAQDRLLPNGRAAKAGVNRAILSSAWGQVVTFTCYQALRRGKLVITVLPYHRAQECAECPCTAPDNRSSQAVFVCQRCGHTDTRTTMPRWRSQNAGFRNCCPENR